MCDCSSGYRSRRTFQFTLSSIPHLLIWQPHLVTAREKSWDAEIYVVYDLTAHIFGTNHVNSKWHMYTRWSCHPQLTFNKSRVSRQTLTHLRTHHCRCIVCTFLLFGCVKRTMKIVFVNTRTNTHISQCVYHSCHHFEVAKYALISRNAQMRAFMNARSDLIDLCICDSRIDIAHTLAWHRMWMKSHMGKMGVWVSEHVYKCKRCLNVRRRHLTTLSLKIIRLGIAMIPIMQQQCTNLAKTTRCRQRMNEEKMPRCRQQRGWVWAEQKSKQTSAEFKTSSSSTSTTTKISIDVSAGCVRRWFFALFKKLLVARWSGLSVQPSENYLEYHAIYLVWWLHFDGESLNEIYLICFMQLMMRHFAVVIIDC